MSLESTIQIEQGLVTLALNEAASYPKVTREADATVFYAGMGLEGVRKTLQGLPTPRSSDDPVITKYGPVFGKAIGMSAQTPTWFEYARTTAINYLTQFELNPTPETRDRATALLSAYGNHLQTMREL